MTVIRTDTDQVAASVQLDGTGVDVHTSAQSVAANSGTTGTVANAINVSHASGSGSPCGFGARLIRTRPSHWQRPPHPQNKRLQRSTRVPIRCGPKAIFVERVLRFLCRRLCSGPATGAPLCHLDRRRTRISSTSRCWQRPHLGFLRETGVDAVGRFLCECSFLGYVSTLRSAAEDLRFIPRPIGMQPTNPGQI